jgi:hypothetical protein
MALAEGEVGTGTGTIEYSGVSSCLTVTCLLDDGTTVGGHLSLLRVSGKLDSTEVLPKMKELIGSKPVTGVAIVGKLDTWNPAYFDKPLFKDDGERNYESDLERDSVLGAVAEKLGLDTYNITVEDRTGSFTITPPAPTS